MLSLHLATCSLLAATMLPSCVWGAIASSVANSPGTVEIVGDAMPSRRFVATVDLVEKGLQELGSALHPVTVDEAHVVPWSLLARARSLFEGVGWLARGPSEASAFIVLRTLADLTILVAWLRLRIDLHPGLWAAESWRREIEDVLPSIEKRGPPGPVSDEMRAALELKRRAVTEARALAIAESVVDARSRSLIPSVWARVKALDTPAARDAYEILFGHWSEWTHTGSGSLPVQMEGSRIRFDEGAPRDPVQIRSMASAMYAYVLAELSRWLGLGIDEGCDHLRESLVNAERDHARDNRSAAPG